MNTLRWMLALFALLAFGCNEEVTRTQLTFRLNAGPSVVNAVDRLQVTVRSVSKGDQPRDFAKADLRWPVEIVVLPTAGNASTDSVTLIATAYAADGSQLAQQTATATFNPKHDTEVELALGDDAVIPVVDAGEDQQDAAQPDAGEPDSSAPAPENCSTDSTKYKCDDGNPCNGMETCNPKSNDANARGCVPSDSPITCANDMTCDSTTGQCSTCLTKPDGDGDGVNSRACGGTDCNDNNPNVAPGKTERCNGIDDDCDGVRDGAKADADCAASAPKDGTASCVSGVCVGSCTDKTKQIVNGACVTPPAQCPVPNPCSPGACSAGTPTYACSCPVGYRAGLGNTRCAPIGIPLRTIGFETTCDGSATPGTANGELKPIVSDLYASCGVNAITSGSLMTVVQLIKPTTTVVDGITKDTALEVTPGMSTDAKVANAQLSIGFTQKVTELGFDLLDIDNFPGLKIALQAGNTTLPAPTIPALVPGTKHTRFTYLDPANPVDLVTITYTPSSATDFAFIDQLSYRVGGCGDKVVEGTEACDDGNAVQCDGCDNACATSPTSCPGP